jgi:hypothetical protein
MIYGSAAQQPFYKPGLLEHLSPLLGFRQAAADGKTHGYFSSNIRRIKPALI